MATNQELLRYIKEQRDLGVSNEVIVEKLKNAGWAELIIVDAFNAVTAITPAAAVLESEQSESINSPYSVLLAAVLTVSLFVLMNGIFSDIQRTVKNINDTLLLQGVFIIPLLLIAFLLHNSFKIDKKRFKILSLPYFIVSAWVLIRLLWKVGENLLNANTAIGVYIVLGMIIVVLTGIVIFVQKYIKD